MSENKKLRKGVFVCHCGGNISDVVDCGKVAEKMASEDGVVVSRTETFMCSDPAQNMIIEAIKEHELDRIVVASCSPRLHELTFRNAAIRAGLNPYLYEHVNIREQVSWVHGSTHEEATEKASSLVRAALGKMEGARELFPIQVDVTPHALVIGGGVAGLRAALDFSQRGIPVTLVEKTPFLGGRVSQLDRVFPTEDHARELIGKMIEQVVHDPDIEVLVSAEVRHVEGYVGNYHADILVQPRYIRPEADPDLVEKAMKNSELQTDDEFNYGLSKRGAVYKPYVGAYPDTPALDVNLFGSLAEASEKLGADLVDDSQKPQTVSVKAGAIVLATGFSLYTPAENEFGYGAFPEVVTLPQFIRLLDEEGPTGGALNVNGKEINNIGFIHCVGSRQVEGIHEPKEGKSLNPYCSRVCCTATLQAALEVKEKHPEIRVFDFFKDIRTYGRYHEEYYTKAAKAGVLFFKYADDALPTVGEDESGEAALRVSVRDKLTFDQELDVPVDLLVLAVGMEPSDIRDLVSLMKLPVGADGFLNEVHPKLRPVELASQGLFLAGCAQAPMSIDEATGAASAAVAKAARILGKSRIELDPYVAQVDTEKCRGEGACIDACRYAGAIEMIEVSQNGQIAKQARINTALCKGCGSCVAACPHHAIDLAGSTLQQLYAMVDAIAV